MSKLTRQRIREFRRTLEMRPGRVHVDYSSDLRIGAKPVTTLLAGAEDEQAFLGFVEAVFATLPALLDAAERGMGRPLDLDVEDADDARSALERIETYSRVRGVLLDDDREELKNAVDELRNTLGLATRS